MNGRAIGPDDRALIDAATRTLRRTYRKGRHTVAAAVRCPSGRIYTGINVEACGYGPCAEPIAIGTAFTSGEREISAIVAVHRTKDGRYVVFSPCGNCRQLICDYVPDATVIYAEGKKVLKARARELLPGAYETHFD